MKSVIFSLATLASSQEINFSSLPSSIQDQLSMQKKIMGTFAQEAAASEEGAPAVGQTAQVEDYNILSLDGGGIRGIITAAVLDRMEDLAYDKARKTYSIPERKEEKVSMAELFDMIAGTSTGAMLGATLVIPKEEGSKIPKYYANHYLADFKKKGAEIYVRKDFDWASFSVIVTLTFLACFILGYFYGQWKYTNKNTEALIEGLRGLIKKMKYDKLSQEGSKTMTETEAKVGFGQSLKQQLGNALLAQYDDLANYENGLENGRVIAQKLKGGSIEEIREAEALCRNTVTSYKKEKRKKWYIACSLSVFGGLIAAGVLYGIYFTSDSSYDRSKFNSFITKQFGTYKFDDAITSELMVVAYAYNKREPRFYTKFTAAHDPETFDITIADAVEGSTSFPGYFQPFEVNGEIIVDGALIANNPAYYADSFARHLYGKESVNTVSIGAGRPDVKPISPKETVSALTWLQRLRSLILAAGMRTHEAMSVLLSTEEERFQTYTNIGYDAGSKVDELEEMGQKLYSDNFKEISLLLDGLLEKKFGK